ncbi:telomere-capping, CST complex subunit-domain-containing protein [Fimicolochytrium jonesii]|uniref:telomere-capping, CST complex subunit-domain-containing protein n=1 Tax=Fimicolochytrium jonesii TaxID=1396493 RepID=UPI0022FE8AF6|nr:telomere-capping, CST complex subunit-domain-containing protein [Fimicolochytrium jonesii]KAI8818896.1 telomere-capping, CST complex subunit-domain-containing protein [Fimicolochytrium jonesii]
MTRAAPARRHGEILTITEILVRTTAISSTPQPLSVRVLGTLIAYDSNNSLALIEYGKARLVVDTALLGPFRHRLRTLLQFIGDVECDWRPPNRVSFDPPNVGVVVRARIVRNVEGLDVRLYEQAMKLRLEFGV